MVFSMILFLIFPLFTIFAPCSAFPDQGVWSFPFDQKNNEVNVVKSLFKNSRIHIEVICNRSSTSNITIIWTLRESECWQEYFKLEQDDSDTKELLNNRTKHLFKSDSKTYQCDNHIILGDAEKESSPATETSIFPVDTSSRGNFGDSNHLSVFTTKTDGFYILYIKIQDKDFSATVNVRMKGSYGYLSAADWPLLPFYGGMCLMYLLMGLAWLVVSFLQWRDLLRIQFWIGGVILLGMLEMATFYAEYSSFNSSGTSVFSVVLLAELVSCGKRTLARMLVIVVSLGFGIVKPRLGPMLHRVVVVGILYFVLASVEAYMRLKGPKAGQANQLLVASFPLALLDSAICWWIFTSLVQTTRTLRLRRNLIKLTLYRHFTNTLAFAVLASVIFMVYSIKAHHLTVCFKDWKELWIDEAYWKLLFSVLLLVIMILWRPTNNNQRYAFSPLIDAGDDDEDDEEEQFVNDAYGVKMRSQGNSSPKPRNNSNSADEDLKWVEDHIPASLANTALPILDSDEEIMTTKFELSKMQ